MGNNKKAVLALLAFMNVISAFAQTSSAGTNADVNKGVMTSEGKIYVVMVIALTILAGLIIYVSRLDRKISKLEKGENL